MASLASTSAICAQHPNAPAAITCARCGDHACVDCAANLGAEQELCLRCHEIVGVGRYHAPPVARFLAMSVLTFGLYPMYWSYRCFKRIKERDHTGTWPALYAFFLGFTYYNLITDVNTHLVLRKSKREPVSTMYALGFFVLMGLSRLPGPWMLLFLGSFACLVPTLKGMRELTGAQELAEGDR